MFEWVEIDEPPADTYHNSLQGPDSPHAARPTLMRMEPSLGNASLGGLEADEPQPWALPEPEPTNLIALWPQERPPTPRELLEALAAGLDREPKLLQEPNRDHRLHSEVEWSAAVEVPTLPHPVVFWAEPARALAPGELDDPRAEACRWVIGAETLLDFDDPLASYAHLVDLLAGAFPAVPAILDVNTTRWHRRAELDRIFGADGSSEPIEPPTDVLWMIHVVESRRPRDASEGVAWIHTHGLWRCGRPELEMLGVPADDVAAASHLVNGIAELLLEQALPPPGAPLEIGHGLHVTFRPWQEVVAGLDPDLPGSGSDRGEAPDNAHGGVRAVVCAAGSDEAGLWPRSIVKQLGEHHAIIYRTTRSTERQSRLARDTWPDLAHAFSSAPAGDRRRGWSFFLKAGFREDDGETAPREHLWFELCRIEPERAEARLLNRPHTVGRLTRGDLIWLDREVISDWQVRTPSDGFGPDDVAALSRAVDQSPKEHPS